MGIFVSTDAFIEEGNSTEIRNFEEQMGLKDAPTLGIPIEDFLIKNSSSIQTLVNEFEQKLKDLSNGTLSYETVSPWVKEYAERLWTNAMGYVQGGANDDRPLYWARIKMEVALKNHFKSQMNGTSVIENTELSRLIQLLEEKSRNYTGIDFTGVPNVKKKILITGFDPFDLDYKPEQNNPSGIIALALHGKEISDNKGNVGIIQAAIVPVRYEDFDKGVIENIVTPFIKTNGVDMIMSISLNADYYYFDLERFAGKYRGGGSDNMNMSNKSKNFKQISGIPKYTKEFYQTTLPVNAIVTEEVTNNYDIESQRFFYDQSYYCSDGTNRDHAKKGNLEPNTNIDAFDFSELNGKISDEGSGGNYLSNEIFYRIARQRELYKTDTVIKTGHLHVPNLEPYIPNDVSVRPYTMNEIIEETTEAIKRCLEYL